VRTNDSEMRDLRRHILGNTIVSTLILFLLLVVVGVLSIWAMRQYTVDSVLVIDDTGIEDPGVDPVED